MSRNGYLRRSMDRCWSVLLVLLVAMTGNAQVKVASHLNVVMLSDLHLDPFRDPAKVPLLAKAPVGQWEGILQSADTANQAAELASVQSACGGKGASDSSFALLQSGLLAARKAAPNASFVTVSGDLLTHDLDCRYRASMKLASASAELQMASAAFAEKTSEFVIRRVESVFKGIPVYIALGNNDSRCNHNRLDLHDEYLKATAQAVIDGLVDVSAEERAQALVTYASAGYYGITMAGPMERTRFLVMDDIYMMTKYGGCETDNKDPRGAQEQITWLTKELQNAQARGERVWVMGHVPPTVDPLSTLLKGFVLCAGGHAESFVDSGALETAIASHGNLVKLAIFGHTHMDEFHLFGTREHGVPVKVVASISPVVGNLPSFTVGMVDAASASLVDYTVYQASNTTGVGTIWSREYSFGETYHESSFSARAVGDLIGHFRSDAAGTGAESLAYQKHYFKGMTATLPGPLWKGYVCSLDHATGDDFKACVCGGQ